MTKGKSPGTADAALLAELGAMSRADIDAMVDAEFAKHATVGAMATTSTISYYATDDGKQLFRRTKTSSGGLVDEAYRDGKWQSTKRVIDYMAGHDDDIDSIDEGTARKMEPKAF